MTDKSIVLLKNEGRILPLNKSTIHSIAVICGGGNEVFPDWYAGTPPYAVTPAQGIRTKVGAAVHVRCVRDNINNRMAAKVAADSDVAIVFVGNNPTCGA